MQKTEHKLNFTDWLETVPNSKRNFLAKVGKGVLLASLGMFGAGCEVVNRGLLDQGLIPIVLEDLQAAELPKPDMLVHSDNPFNSKTLPTCCVQFNID